MYQNFIISYLCEAQHVSGDTPPIIRSLILHWKPLVFHTWKIVWTCSWWTLSGTVWTWQRPPTSRSTTFHVWKTRGWQCSIRLLIMGGVSPEICRASHKYEIIKILINSCILLHFSLWIVLWRTDPRTSSLKINFVFFVQEDSSVFSLFVYVIRKNSGIPLFVLFNVRGIPRLYIFFVNLYVIPKQVAWVHILK
jgi:hypothetical protein